MENHRLFIVLDHQGMELFHNLVNQFTQIQSTPETEDTPENDPINMDDDPLNKDSVSVKKDNDSVNKDEWVSVLTYPSFFDSLSIDELPHIFFEWVNKYFDGFDQQFLDTLTTIKNSISSRKDVDEEEQTHMTTSLHELADCLHTGSTLLEVYVFGSKEQFAKTNLPLLSALKRLDVCYPAQFVIVSEENLSRVVWTNYIDLDVLTVEELFQHLQSLPLWAGTLNMKIQQCNADIPLQYYFMYADHDSSKLKHPTLFSAIQEDTTKKKKVSFDSKIQLITLVRTEDVPFHLVHGCRFTLRTVSKRTQDEGFDLFSASQMKGKFFVGVLRYNDRASHEKYTTRDWRTHVGDPFTHYLNSLYTEKDFPKHRALLLDYDEQQGTIQLYFFLPPDEINSAGLVELLKRDNVYLKWSDPVEEDSADSELQFYKNGADIMHPWEWCEKNAWHEEENTSKVVKSISRLKSDELFMQGVMIPGIEPLNNNNNNNNNNNSNTTSSEHDLIDTVLSMFDEKGMPLRSPLKDILIIEDRLLKGVKCEESINMLSYEEASKVIGHGLDYCTDSLNMLHLSDRLTKVQKRFIPKDTVNMMTGNLTKKEEETIAAAKKVIVKPIGRSTAANTKVTKNAAAGQKKESRSAKTKRRLRTICEGTVVKYGDVEQKHMCYEACVDTLFTKCLALCKELTSSKDLNSLMKQFAKEHITDVVKEVLGKQED